MCRDSHARTGKCDSYLYLHADTQECNANAHFLREAQASESPVSLASLAAPQVRSFLAAFQAPLGGQSFPNQHRGRAQGWALPPDLLQP